MSAGPRETLPRISEPSSPLDTHSFPFFFYNKTGRQAGGRNCQWVSSSRAGRGPAAETQAHCDARRGARPLPESSQRGSRRRGAAVAQGSREQRRRDHGFQSPRPFPAPTPHRCRLRWQTVVTADTDHTMDDQPQKGMIWNFPKIQPQKKVKAGLVVRVTIKGLQIKSLI